MVDLPEKNLSRENALAYFYQAFSDEEKSFIPMALIQVVFKTLFIFTSCPLAEVVKLFTAAIYKCSL